MNIIEGIILIIFEYHKSAKWSKEYKGNAIDLSEDDSKATCTDEAHSVRAHFCIPRDGILSWELECKIGANGCNFFGVVSSKVTDFDDNPDCSMKDAYGLDDEVCFIYQGANVVGSDWHKPEFPINEVFLLRFVADWREKQCKLNIFYDGKRLNEDENYTMLLPELNENFVWYPCVTPYNKGAYCIIRYTEA